MKKKVWLPILGLLVLLAMAAGAYTFLYLPEERTFQAAMAASRQAPYAEARQALTAARASDPVNRPTTAMSAALNMSCRSPEIMIGIE